MMPRNTFSIAVIVCLVAGPVAWTQDHPTATAPPNMGILEHTATGVMYADEGLVNEYKQLKEQIRELRGQLFRDGELASAKRDELAELEKQLPTLLAKIDDKKFHAQPFKVFTQRDTQSFELEESEQIVITSDDVIIRGWNGKNIKCVVEKTVLAEDEPDEAEFAAIVVKHESRLADDLIGLSDEAREASEQKYLASEAGQKLDEAGRQRRAKFVAEIHDSFWMYKPLQGHAVNVLQIGGLHGQEGNKHLTGGTTSPGGGGTLGGYWKRSAKVTIYVPQCKDIAIRGCKKAVDIKSVQANLIVTTHGSQDNSYGNDFAIRDIDGDVTVYQAPIRVIHSVRGNLRFHQTDEYTNTGTTHRGGMRTTSSPPPHPTTVSEVTGNIAGLFVRADLYIEQFDGALDVINEYGNTTLTIDKPLTKAAHRILSHSGTIRAIIEKADSTGIKVFAFTQTGTVQTAFPRDTFDDKSFGNGSRSWYGYQTAGERFDFGALSRPANAWENSQRADGIDLISNGGAVIVSRANKNR